MASILAKVRGIPFWVTYLILGLAIVFSYSPIREIMINQEGSFMAIMSGLTLNIILLYFIWGVASDKLTKGKSKRFGWTVFFIGLFVLTLTFRFVGGLETIFG